MKFALNQGREALADYRQRQEEALAFVCPGCAQTITFDPFTWMVWNGKNWHYVCAARSARSHGSA